jgi:hypothetical protein
VPTTHNSTEQDIGYAKYREARVGHASNRKSLLVTSIALWRGFFNGDPDAKLHSRPSRDDRAHEVFRPGKAVAEQEQL